MAASRNLTDDESRSGPWTEVKFGPEYEGRYIAEERQNDTYAYVWIDFMNPESRRRQRIWWPEPAQSINVVLQKMFTEHFGDYRKTLSAKGQERHPFDETLVQKASQSS